MVVSVVEMYSICIHRIIFLFLVIQPPPTVAPKNFRATVTTQTTIDFSWDAIKRGAETFRDVSMYIIRCFERNHNTTVNVSYVGSDAT